MHVNIEVTAGPARGRVFNIDQADLFIVGRARDSKISLPNDPYLSRQHFVLEIAPPNCKITDLGSKNGTFVNGVRYGGRKPDPKVRQAPNEAMSVTVQSGEIVVGDTRMKIRVDTGADASRTLSKPNDRTRSRENSAAPTVVRAPQTAPVAPEPNAPDSQASAERDAVQGIAVPPADGRNTAAPGPVECDSSLGFLVPHAHSPSMQAEPVPSPGSNASALNIRRAHPASGMPKLVSAFGKPGASPRTSGTHFDTKAETVKADPGSDITARVSPIPGVEADHTVMENPDGGLPPEPPFGMDDELNCAQCGRDVTREAGARGRIQGAEYICHECRANRAFAAKERIAKRINPAQPAATAAQFPAASGMDYSKYANIHYPGYKVVDVLGSGGMGVVYKATRDADGVFVAIKSLLPNVPVSFENYRIFHREIELTSKLRHPNIVEVLNHGRVKGAYYCVLEYVDGMSLKDYVIQMGGKLSLKQAAPLMLDTLSGLAAAHHANIETRASGPRMMSGIVHRDLKPENILLRRDAFGWIPKIADFGIAKSFESAGMTDMTVAGVCGTPTYWPREQLTHYRYLHPATDVFSIAAVFYEMLSGRCARPGMQETLVQCHRRSVSPELADFMRVIGSNPIPPIRDAVPTIPQPIAAVIDKALQEVEVPLDEVEMRETLQRLRYPDAGAFREALVSAFKYSNIGV